MTGGWALHNLQQMKLFSYYKWQFSYQQFCSEVLLSSVKQIRCHFFSHALRGCSNSLVLLNHSCHSAERSFYLSSLWPLKKIYWIHLPRFFFDLSLMLHFSSCTCRLPPQTHTLVNICLSVAMLGKKAKGWRTLLVRGDRSSVLDNSLYESLFRHQVL